MISDITLAHHLQYNHYPPVHLDFLPIAKQAIELANQGEWDTELVLPNMRVATVSAVVEGLHLEYFMEVLND